MAEKSCDVISNGLDDAFSEFFPGRGDYAWAPGKKFPSDVQSEYEWVWINDTTKRLVKRTSPR